jgi:hypothetical protein
MFVSKTVELIRLCFIFVMANLGFPVCGSIESNVHKTHVLACVNNRKLRSILHCIRTDESDSLQSELIYVRYFKYCNGS